MRNQFITALIQLFKIENNPVTIKAIDKMTKHIDCDQYAEFVEECGKPQQYKRPIEIIKSVSDKYLDEIKSELFKDVEAEAKELENKLEAYFFKIDEMFRPSSKLYDAANAYAFKTPSKLIETAVIRSNGYWNDKDAYLINKIGLRALYDVFNNPYKQVWEVLANEMKNTITQKYLMPKSNNIENRVEEIKQLANKTNMNKKEK